MKLYYHTDGEPDVGISDGTIIVDMDEFVSRDNFSQEELDEVRNTLKNCFDRMDFNHNGSQAWWDDECSACGSILDEENNCSNRNCYEYIDSGEILQD